MLNAHDAVPFGQYARKLASTPHPSGKEQPGRPPFMSHGGVQGVPKLMSSPVRYVSPEQYRYTNGALPGPDPGARSRVCWSRDLARRADPGPGGAAEVIYREGREARGLHISHGEGVPFVDSLSRCRHGQRRHAPGTGSQGAKDRAQDPQTLDDPRPQGRGTGEPRGKREEDSDAPGGQNRGGEIRYETAPVDTETGAETQCKKIIRPPSPLSTGICGSASV